MSLSVHNESPLNTGAAVGRSEVLYFEQRIREQPSPSIQELLDLLLLTEEKTEQYARQHSLPGEARNSEDASTAEALEWVQTAFQDISATLEAISRAPLPVRHPEH
ncbi:hypothetical protein [Arthrobacter rhombi]|uniref:hypothetical protein n=1 Tax=Arthrobacter rhombi TaxID=71253 RepID=UPI003FD1A153